MTRTPIPPAVEAAVLLKCARRCALCFGLSGDRSFKRGQVAHIDHDASHSTEDNLAFLCLPHHDEYDSRPSQSKSFTTAELRRYKASLEASLSPPPRAEEATVGSDAHAAPTRRFWHGSLTARGLLDLDASHNPYQPAADPTAQERRSAIPAVTCYLWLPSIEYFESSDHRRFTPAAAVCTSTPPQTLRRLAGGLTDSGLDALRLIPSRLRNEEKALLLCNAASALRRAIGLAAAFPADSIGVGRSRPQVSYHAMTSLFLVPILSFHRSLGVPRMNLRLAHVGAVDSHLMSACKRVLGGCYPRKAAYSASFVEPNDADIALLQLARLFAWLTQAFYNFGNDRWLRYLQDECENQERGPSHFDEPPSDLTSHPHGRRDDGT